MELLKVWAALLRRKWLFLQAVVFFTVGAVVLALVLPKQYAAAAKVSVESSSSSMSILSEMDLSEMAQSLAGGSDDMQTKMALATMRPILDEVIWRLQLRDMYGELLPAEKLLVPGLDGQVLAAPWIELEEQQGTTILVVTSVANTPELAALLADTVVEVFLADSVERAKSDTRDALTFVKTEQQRLKVQFDTAMGNVAAALRAESVIDLDAETKAAVGRASALVSEIGAVEAQLADLDAQAEKRAQLNERESEALVAPGTLATNTQVRELRSALTELRLAKEKQLLDKTARHPDIVQLDKQIASVTAELRQALAEEHQLDSAVETLGVQYAGLRERRAELLRLVGETVQEAGEFPEKGRRLAELQLAADATQAVYKSLIEQEYQIAVAEAMTVADMKSVEPARIPERHDAPKLLVFLILGGFVGTCMGFALVFLFEYVDDSVTTFDDLREVWPLAALGVIPRFRHRKGANPATLDPTDPLLEAYRAVRNSIAFAGVDQRIDVLTVTSCAPGEGKSTFAVHLATCFALDGHRVVVVDCDFRRPTQHRNFADLVNDRGVSSVLNQTTPLADAVQATPLDNLFVLTSGPLPSNPGRVVESLRLRQVVQELARTYEMVIVDAPPLLAVSDAVSLSRASRGTLLVVESERTTRRMLSDARARLEAGGVEPIGAVLNKVQEGRTGGYYRQYARLYTQAPAARPAPGKNEQAS